MRGVSLFGLLVWVLSATGCPLLVPSGPLQSDVFTGALAADGLQVGLTHSDAGTALYVCGAGDTLESHTRWFIDDQPLATDEEIVLEADGWRATLVVTQTDAEEFAQVALAGPGGEDAALELAGNWQSAQPMAVFHDGNGSCRGGAVALDADAASSVQGASCPDAVQIQVVPVDVGPEQMVGSIDRSGTTETVTMDSVVVADLFTL